MASRWPPSPTPSWSSPAPAAAAGGSWPRSPPHCGPATSRSPGRSCSEAAAPAGPPPPPARRQPPSAPPQPRRQPQPRLRLRPPHRPRVGMATRRRPRCRPPRRRLALLPPGTATAPITGAATAPAAPARTAPALGQDQPASPRQRNRQPPAGSCIRMAEPAGPPRHARRRGRGSGRHAHDPGSGSDGPRRHRSAPQPAGTNANLPGAAGSAVDTSVDKDRAEGASQVRGLARGGGLNLGGAVVSQVANVGITLLIARLLGRSALGTYAQAYAFLALLVPLSSFGLGVSVTRFVAIHLADGDHGAVRGTIRIGIAVATISAGVLGAALYLAAPRRVMRRAAAGQPPARPVYRPGELFRFSLIAWLAVLASYGLIWADTILLGLFRPSDAVGVYNV